MPGFNEVNVDEALQRVFGKIRKNCYGEREEREEGSDEASEEQFVMRTKPHEKSLCEACLQGICCLEDAV